MKTETYKQGEFNYDIYIEDCGFYWAAKMGSKYGDRVCRDADTRETLEKSLSDEGYYKA